MGFALGSAGVLIGPSMGQWCLGRDYARKSIPYAFARIAGMGGVALTLEWVGRQELGDVVFHAPFIGAVIGLAAAGLFATVVWTIEKTPQLACNETERGQIVTMSPTVDPSGGPGVQFAIQF